MEGDVLLKVLSNIPRFESWRPPASAVSATSLASLAGRPLFEPLRFKTAQ